MNRFKTIASEIKNRPDIIEILDGDKDIGELFNLSNTLPADRLSLYKSLYEGIGNTPVYEVNLPNENLLHIKAEYFNPMGNSHYSRVWIPYLFIAEVLNVITPGESHFIEVTSGNSGIALAFACQELNYNLTLVIPKDLPVGRIKPMVDYGATIVKVDGYIDKCIYQLRRLVVTDNLFPTNHSEEKADVQIKIMKRIAAEYYRQFGVADYNIIGLGNGTSTRAIFQYFKAKYNDIQNIVFYPDPKKEEIILGLYIPFKLRHIEPALELSDQTIYTSGSAVKDVTSLYKHDTEIVNLGHSSLHGIHIATNLAENVNNKTFFTLAYDKIDRYV